MRNSGLSLVGGAVRRWGLGASLVAALLIGADTVAAASPVRARGATVAPRGSERPVPAARIKVCVIALNEPHELAAVRANLDERHFEFIDLREVAQRNAPPGFAPSAGDTSWLSHACTPDTTCDVVIYSAEFAGRFFGKSGPSLGLQELEELSCQPRCAGLFRRPMEVFLMACNTLANKNEDSRTPAEYLQVLLDHGFDRASAERVVELRYGPLGPSFRESLRRIFAGVPRIYGFSSVAPRGEYTAPMLTRYFRAHDDYADALRRRARTTARNQTLLRAFRGTSMTQIAGLGPLEPGAMDRDHICALYDESRTLTDRLQIAYGFLLRPDALTFIPTLEVFLRRHPPHTFQHLERSIFAEIQALDRPREAVLSLVNRLNVSALKLELAHFAVQVGWLEPAEMHAIAVNGAKELLGQPLTAEAVDIMCEITKHASLRDAFTAQDIPFQAYRDALGLRLLSCIAPKDPAVAPRVIPALRATDWMQRQWAAHTLTILMPSDEEVLLELVPYVRDPEVGPRIRWMFQAHEELPRSVRRRLDDVDPSLLRTAGGARAWRRQRAGDAPGTAAYGDPVVTTQ